MEWLLYFLSNVGKDTTKRDIQRRGRVVSTPSTRGSDLHPNTGYFDYDFLRFPSARPGKYRDSILD
jgi:hypothetical protein